ncbi:hypothetical protein CEUSTIGMA_g13220.t1 [Chlamydomonas eustigma]|uniref:Protochlorophyllide reductase n=1 Tax=Chlamydomonas eustigma TaxID=1157962 RepID=A0A250XRX5_9CHLO|nr:hypothetical protein CEUSTIGMA_g13220.t1 [Chlamydomonas eustigma]|eukprot:GAX85805.1 hypothetical protein CEUSTIGMA_g13220.t1 [Chlamydomonas eustigma]
MTQGHRIVLTFRDEFKARDAVDSLLQELTTSGHSQAEALKRVSWVKMDLLSFASVKAASAELRRNYEDIDTVLLNAGIQPSTSSFQFSEDGWETTYQANHLSHFLLTHLLIPSLLSSKACGGARIVVVSSELHTELGLGSIEPPPNYFHSLTAGRAPDTTISYYSKDQAPPEETTVALSPIQIYSLTKLYNLWFTFKLSAMCREAGLPITVDAVTPGFVPTSNLAKAGLSMDERQKWDMTMASHPYATPLSVGAQRVADVVAGPGAFLPRQALCSQSGLSDSVEMASEEEAGKPHNYGANSILGGADDKEDVVFGTGRYFSNGKPLSSSAASRDLRKQDALWDLSMEATGLSGVSYLPLL